MGPAPPQISENIQMSYVIGKPKQFVKTCKFQNF